MVFLLSRSGWHTVNQRVRRDIVGNNGACACARPLAEGHRGDQHGITANEGILPNDGWILLLPIIVAGDRAGADVDLFADGRVANIGK
jgi:hypothetical protein